MGLLENMEKTAFLGSEFMIWLWCMSEKNNGLFEVEEIGKVDIWFYDNIKLEKGYEKDKESVLCTGPSSQLREARLGLTTGKELREARIKIIIGDDEWYLTLDSKYLDFKGLKTPKVEKISDGDEADEENRLFEKISLIEKAVKVMDKIFLNFLNERMSNRWAEAIVPSITEWRESTE